MNNIEQVEKQIKTWCDENKVEFIHAEISDEINYVNVDSQYELVDFLNLGKKNNINHIIISKSLFDYDSIEFEIIDELRIDDDDLVCNIQSIIEKYSNHDNQIETLDVHWVKDGIIYKSFYEAEWFNEFNTKIDEVIKEYKEQRKHEKNAYLTEERSRYPFSTEHRTNICTQLASHPDYLKNVNRPSKLNPMIIEILKAEEVEISERIVKTFKWGIKPEASTIFDNEYREVAEEDLRKKISSMIANGESNKEIIAKLDIAESLFHKYK